MHHPIALALALASLAIVASPNAAANAEPHGRSADDLRTKLRTALGAPIDGDASYLHAEWIAIHGCERNGMGLEGIRKAPLKRPVPYGEGKRLEGRQGGGGTSLLDALPWSYGLAAIATCRDPGADPMYITLIRTRGTAWRADSHHRTSEEAAERAQVVEPRALRRIQAPAAGDAERQP